MSVNQGRSKAKKRYLDTDIENSSKRTRTEESLAKRTKSVNRSGGKNLAAKRLNALRQNIKNASKTIKDTLKRSTQICPKAKSNSSYSTQPCKQRSYTDSPKKCSINDRLTRIRQKGIGTNEDDVIIEIDDSPLPSSNKCLDSGPIQKSNRVKSHKEVTNDSITIISDSEESFKAHTPINQRLNKIKKKPSFLQDFPSFTVVSEASESEETHSPIGQRLSTIKEYSTSYNSSKSESSEKNETECSNNSLIGSGELRLSLKRKIFENTKETSRNESNFDKAIPTHKIKEAQVLSRVFEKQSPTKGTNFGQNVHDDYQKSANNNIFASESLEGKLAKKEESSVNIFRQSPDGHGIVEQKGNTLNNRLKKIRNERCRSSFDSKEPDNVNSESQTEVVGSNQMITETETGILGALVNVPRIPKSLFVQDWMHSTFSRPNAIDHTMSESMIVNVDDTLLNKSELLTEPQENDSMEWDAISETEPLNFDKTPSITATVDLKKENVICVVTDTNVFMHDLSKLKDLLNFKIPGDQKLKIYVPWMVLQELDFHKDSQKQPAKSMALAAQKWINRHLAEPESRVTGQSVEDVCQQMDLGKSPDDKILACCLQAKNKFETVILLSNDVNLCNKVMTNNIKGYTAKEILGKLRSNSYLKIKARLQPLLSQVILDLCREAFGEACWKMDMLQGFPWSFEGCLKRFKKYWRSVFGHLMLKHCLKIIEELIALTNRGDITEPTELNNFKNKVKEFLFYLQDIDQFKSAAKKIRDEIDHIV